MAFDFVPILIQALVAIIIAVGVIVIAHLIGSRNPTPAKLAPYECGMSPVGQAWRRFPIKFFLTAMLFVLFDIEVIFFVPWAAVLRHLRAGGSEYVLFALGEMAVFVGFLALGYVYILKKRALEWEA